MPRQIVFDRSLYLPEAVEAAAAAYAGHAEITLQAGGDAVEATIAAADDELDMLVNAFCNHVLYETIARRRRSPEGEPA